MGSPPRTSAVIATQPRWRFWVTLGAWVAVVVGFVLGFQNFGHMFGMGVGIALGAERVIDEQVHVWWSFIAIAIGLVVAAVTAAVARRWVACGLALFIAAACAFFALVLFSSVRDEIAPTSTTEHVDIGPAPCACYSGSPCDCPAG